MTMAERETATFVRNLMTDFAERTGLIGEQPPTRYLWTDAFAVCIVRRSRRKRPPPMLESPG